MEPAADVVESRASSTVSVAAWVLAALALGCDIAYVMVIAQQGNFSSGWPVVVFVAAYALSLSVAAIAGRRASNHGVRSGFLSWASAGSIATGLAGAFSLVFVPLLPAGVVLLLVTSRSERERVSPLWAGVAAVVLVAGLIVANLLETQ